MIFADTNSDFIKDGSNRFSAKYKKMVMATTLLGLVGIFAVVSNINSGNSYFESNGFLTAATSSDSGVSDGTFYTLSPLTQNATYIVMDFPKEVEEGKQAHGTISFTDKQPGDQGWWVFT